MNTQSHQKMVAIAQREAQKIIDEMTARDASTSDAIRRALAQSLYTAALGALVESKCAALESTVTELERRLAAEKPAP